MLVERDRYFIAEQLAPAPHLALPGGCAALRIVLVTVPRVSRSCEHFPDGFDLHLLRLRGLARPEGFRSKLRLLPRNGFDVHRKSVGYLHRINEVAHTARGGAAGTQTSALVPTQSVFLGFESESETLVHSLSASSQFCFFITLKPRVE